eukprot:3279209-Alexandrium_andersonii.AAC.1
MIVEELKLLSPDDLEGLAAFMTRCWETATFPQQWGKAEVVGIFKKGSHRLACNYRPISLLEVAYKLFARVLAARLQAALGGALRSTQFGFLPGKSTVDAIGIVRRSVEL